VSFFYHPWHPITRQNALSKFLRLLSIVNTALVSCHHAFHDLQAPVDALYASRRFY
jgi:hypothetical protein